MIWFLLNNGTPEDLGFIPSFLDEQDPRRAREQLDAHYNMGGGWSSKPHRVDDQGVMHYPGDPPLLPIAVTGLHREQVFVYPLGYVSIVQPDGSFVVQRMD
jgi:hypothetical protein